MGRIVVLRTFVPLLCTGHKMLWKVERNDDLHHGCSTEWNRSDSYLLHYGILLALSCLWSLVWIGIELHVYTRWVIVDSGDSDVQLYNDRKRPFFCAKYGWFTKKVVRGSICLLNLVIWNYKILNRVPRIDHDCKMVQQVPVDDNRGGNSIRSTRGSSTESSYSICDIYKRIAVHHSFRWHHVHISSTHLFLQVSSPSFWGEGRRPIFKYFIYFGLASGVVPKSRSNPEKHWDQASINFRSLLISFSCWIFA